MRKKCTSYNKIWGKVYKTKTPLMLPLYSHFSHVSRQWARLWFRSDLSVVWRV